MQNIKVYKIKNLSAQATRGQQNTSSCWDDTQIIPKKYFYVKINTKYL